jgi:hypothetical protein
MPVAIGWRVDEDEKLFFADADAGAVFAILGADINRRFPRQPVVAENVVELGGIIL